MNHTYRVNLNGLAELVKELGGPDGEHLPIVFRQPASRDHEINFAFRASIEMISEDVTDKPFRALVVTPVEW